MRVQSNCRWSSDTMATIAEVAREAQIGGGFSKTMITRAFRQYGRHKNSQHIVDNYENIHYAHYDGAQAKC